jgi:hypothetical protein
MNRQQAIVFEANKLVGVKELGYNAGFSDAKFQGDMEEIGWREGLPWCAYFCMNIYAKVYGKTHARWMHPMVVMMFARARQLKIFTELWTPKINHEPKLGSIVCWGVGGAKSTKGHCGIVVGINADGTFETVEGNTSGASLSRDGDGVWKKHRTMRTGKWQLLGFITLEATEPNQA